MLVGGGDDSFGNDLHQSLSDAMVLMRHVVADFLGVDIEEPHLDTLNDLLGNLQLSSTINLDFILDLFDFLRFVLLDLFQLLDDVQQEEVLVLRVFSQVCEEGLSNVGKVLFESIEKLPHPQVFVLNRHPFPYFQSLGLGTGQLGDFDLALENLVVHVLREKVAFQVGNVVQVQQ